MTERPKTGQRAPEEHHVCPWWLGYFLSCPLRRFWENPEKMLGPQVRPGMKVVEPGCGMGFFSLPLARMVGPQGRVICVDLQPPMIKRLLKRVQKVGLSHRLEASVCTATDLGLSRWQGTIDLVTAIHVIHEVPDPFGFLSQARELLKPCGRLLVVEPSWHVSVEAFEATRKLARQVGFGELVPPRLKREHTALFEKPPDS